MTSASSTDRLEQIQHELAAILEERLGSLATVLRASESITRRIVATEMEIERHTQDRSRLEAELATLRAAADTYGSQSQRLLDEHSELLAFRDEQRASVARLEAEVREADGENERARRRMSQLEEEASALREDNADLKMKLRTIEENIARMKALREEIMSSISGQTAHMKRLAGTGLE